MSHPSQQLATVGLRPLNSKLPVLLFVGNSEHYEFLPFTEVLRKSDYPFHAVANLPEAIRFLEKNPDLPDLIIIGQLWPEEFSSDDPVVLSQIAPLARFAWCLGSWCPPLQQLLEYRQGDVYSTTHSNARLLLRQLDLFTQQKICSLNLPLTARRDERFETSFIQTPDPEIPTSHKIHSQHNAESSSIIAIRSNYDDLKRLLEETCARYFPDQTLILSGEDPIPATITCLIWDMTPWTKQTIVQLEQIRITHSNIRIIALIDFPRSDIHEWLYRFDVETIFCKPLALNDLVWSLANPTETSHCGNGT